MMSKEDWLRAKEAEAAEQYDEFTAAFVGPTLVILFILAVVGALYCMS